MKVVNRVKANEDFALTIKKGKTYQCDSFRIHISENTYGYTRVGISVSKKLGNAVIRSRIKRQIRAICDSVIEYNKQALDIIVIAKAEFLDKTFAENKSLFSDLLYLKAGLNK